MFYAKIMYICQENESKMKKKALIAAITGIIMTIAGGCGEKIGKLEPETDYLTFAVTESNHPALEEGVYVYMMRNPDKDCLFCRLSDSSPSGLELIVRGTYDVDVKIEYSTTDENKAEAIPFITLNYPSDEEENFASDDTAPVTHHFTFEVNDSDTRFDSVLNYFELYLAVNWNELVNNAVENSRPKDTKVLANPTLRISEDGTPYSIVGELVISPEPPKAD